MLTIQAGLSCSSMSFCWLLSNCYKSVLWEKTAKDLHARLAVLQLLLDTQIFLFQPIFRSVINVGIEIGCSLSLKYDRFSTLCADKNHWDYLSYYPFPASLQYAHNFFIRVPNFLSIWCKPFQFVFLWAFAICNALRTLCQLQNAQYYVYYFLLFFFFVLVCIQGGNGINLFMTLFFSVNFSVYFFSK